MLRFVKMPPNKNSVFTITDKSKLH